MKDSFQKEGVPQKEFLKDLSLLIVKLIYQYDLWKVCG